MRRYALIFALLAPLEVALAQLVAVDTSVRLKEPRQDFVVTGASTRQLHGHQSNVFDLAVSGIPDGATVRKAYLNWTYLTNRENHNNIEGTLYFGGNVVVGNESGVREPDLGWGRTHIVSYLAEVTDLVSGNGSYTIVDGVDELSNFTADALGEGISLVVLYEHPDLPRRKIDVYSGLWSTMFDEDPMEFSLAGHTGRGPINFFLNGIDGQDLYGDDVYVDDSVLISSSVSGGTVGNAWRGALGPGPVGENYYDHLETDLQGLVGFFGDSFTVRTQGHPNNNPNYTDAIAHSIAVVAYEPVPEPGSIAALSVALFAMRRRQRSKE